jgi:hypothetical protein
MGNSVENALSIQPFPKVERNIPLESTISQLKTTLLEVLEAIALLLALKNSHSRNSLLESLRKFDQHSLVRRQSQLNT